jgi:hypothetical protein
MSNLSELLPTGGGQNAVDFVASGTLSSGQTVVLKADGTVEAVAETANPENIGSATVYANAGSTTYNSAVFDSANNKVVIAYGDNGNSSYGTAVVGTVSGTSISFGTPAVFESSAATYICVTFDSLNNKIVICYRATSAYGYGIVGTVSGTGISFGSRAAFESSTVYFLACTFDSAANKAVVGYSNPSNSYYARSAVGTVSGTSISFGTPVVIQSADSDHFAATFDSNAGKTIICYRNTNNSNYGTAAVGTVSGTSITFGTPTPYNAVNSTYNSATFDSTNNKVIVACTNINGAYAGTCSVGTVSGTSISFGTPVVFKASNVDYVWVSYNVLSNAVVISYRDRSDTSGNLINGTVSGTSISFGSSSQFSTGNILTITSAYDSANSKTVLSYANYNAGGYGYGLVYTPAYTTTNSADFIGITAEAISSAATGAVNVYGGINEAQTGLTIGSDYYVQADGSLSTTASSVKVGQAISATTINMKDLT